MLHPHVPEELRHFGKHLFATFLGLLMALGLESWHQEHSRNTQARGAEAGILEELKYNRSQNLKLVANFEKVPGNFKLFAGLLQDYQLARKAGRSWKLPEVRLDLGLSLGAGAFRTTSWEMAQSAQLLPRIANVNSYARLYGLIREQRALRDQPIALGFMLHLEGVTSDVTLLKMLEKLDDTELRQLQWTLRDLAARADLMVKMGKSIEEEFVTILGKA